MDIRNWGLNQIMQLPDSAFGRRYVVGLEVKADPGGDATDLSVIPFPQRFVLWELVVEVTTSDRGHYYFMLGITDFLWTTVVHAWNSPPIIPGLFRRGQPNYIWSYYSEANFAIRRIRQPFEGGSRYLGLWVNSIDQISVSARVACVVSSIPNEVPDCLFSR